MIRFEAKTPRRLGLAVIRSVMMFKPVDAMPSATLVGDELEAREFGGELLLEALGAAFERTRARHEVMSATSPSALPYFAAIASARPSAAMRPPWTLSVVKKEVKAFESAAESMPTIG